MAWRVSVAPSAGSAGRPLCSLTLHPGKPTGNERSPGQALGQSELSLRVGRSARSLPSFHFQECGARGRCTPPGLQDFQEKSKGVVWATHSPTGSPPGGTWRPGHKDTAHRLGDNHPWEDTRNHPRLSPARRLLSRAGSALGPGPDSPLVHQVSTVGSAPRLRVLQAELERAAEEGRRPPRPALPSRRARGRPSRRSR